MVARKFEGTADIKKIPDNVLTGKKGITLIDQIVTSMGYVFRPTPELDSGIDGTIEIRDPQTGEMKNFIIQVQSKATSVAFTSETPRGFTYLCSEADVAYWMSGNMPVILVCSRPDANEAYWVSIKDYFADKNKLASRKIYFDKETNRFNADAYSELQKLAVPRDSGIYFSPPSLQENLWTNLLEVAAFAPKIYIADTTFHERKHMYMALNEYVEDAGTEWILKSGRIISFYDLKEYPWKKICDVGTVEHFDTEDWAYSAEIENRHNFIQLLRLCLTVKLRKTGIRFDNELKQHFFVANRDLSTRKLRYPGSKVISNRTLFKGYYLDSKYPYYRHLALESKFRLYGGKWFIELNPTYRYTSDGYQVYRFYEEQLSNMRRIDRNSAMRGQVLFWANYLGMPDNMFRDYPLLKFGQLLTFTVNFGVPEKLWKQDSVDSISGEESSLLFGPLFD